MPDLLAQLAVDRLLDRLAGLDEARQHAVHAAREALPVGEQDLVAARHAHDRGRRDAREGEQVAGRAALRALAGRALGGSPAATAEPVRPVPFDDLKRAAGEGEELLVETCPQRAQLRERGSRGRLGSVVDPGRHAADPVEQAQEVARVGHQPECPEVVGERKLGRLAVLDDEQLGAANAEPEPGTAERGRGLERGLERSRHGLDYARPAQRRPQPFLCYVS